MNSSSQINIPKLLLTLGLFFLLLTGLDIILFTFYSLKDYSGILIDNGTDKAKNVALLTREKIIDVIDINEDSPDDENANFVNQIKSEMPQIIADIELLENARIFDSNGTVIFDSTGDYNDPTIEEQQMIGITVTASTFENKLFQAGELVDYSNIDIYIPVGISDEKTLIVKGEVRLKGLSENYESVLATLLTLGLIVTGLHLLISAASYFVLVRPLRRANEALFNQNLEVEKELSIAKTIQESILPKENPFKNDLNISMAYLSMEAVGGDLIDVIPVSDDAVACLVVDVMGHGIPSAMLTTMIKIAFHTNVNHNSKVNDIISRVNNTLVPIITDSGYYCTAYLGIYHFNSCEFEFTSAGHPPAILLKKESQNLEFIGTGDFNLGMLEGIPYSINNVRLSKGDRIFIYSDGFIEAEDPDGKQFGIDNFKNFLMENSSIEVKELVEKLVSTMQKFSGDKGQNDDLSLIAFEIK